MEFKRSLDGELVIWEYDRLCVVGIEGNLGMPLERFDELFRGKGIEFAPVQRNPHLDSLPAFHPSPPVDIFIAKPEPGYTSVVTYSLGREFSVRLVYELVRGSGFQPAAPSAGFIKRTESNVMVPEKTTYRACIEIARKLGKIWKRSLEWSATQIFSLTRDFREHRVMK